MRRLDGSKTAELMSSEGGVWFCPCCPNTVDEGEEFSWFICAESGMPYKVHAGLCTEVEVNIPSHEDVVVRGVNCETQFATKPS